MRGMKLLKSGEAKHWEVVKKLGNGTSYNYSVAVVAINGDRVFSDYVTGWSIPWDC